MRSFYNNIFASAYRAYDKYETKARYRAASFVFMHIVGTTSIVIVLLKKSSGVNQFTYEHAIEVKWSIILVGLFFLGYSWLCYSEDKIENIISTFEAKPRWQRRFWGYFSVLTFILQWILFIMLM